MHYRIFLLQGLTVAQIKTLGIQIDKTIDSITKRLEEVEEKRNESLREIGNLLHETCVISNDEVRSVPKKMNVGMLVRH